MTRSQAKRARRQMRRKIYMNAKQVEFLRSEHPIRGFRAGRGTGKTHVLGAAAYEAVSRMPRGKGFIAASTYTQLLTKTLPEVIDVWESFGMKEGVHFVVGVKPPNSWKKPYKSPKQYKNVVSIFTGSCIELMSMDRPDLLRGGSYDFGFVDEGLLISWSVMTKVLIPMMRGNNQRFGHIAKHHQLSWFSSVAWKPKGQWVNTFEKFVAADPKRFHLTTACTMDNVAVLGLEYIENLRASLSPLEYSVEVLNKPVTKLPDGFYHKFDADKHCEVVYEYEDTLTGIESKGYKHYNRLQPLDWSMDFGGHINCGLVMQQKSETIKQKKRNVLRILKEFHVKDNRKIKELVKDFCDYYENHGNKLIRLWGEPRGNDAQPDGDAFFVRMEKMFKKRGWRVEIHATHTAEEHDVRHTVINDIFDEDESGYPIIRINDKECPNFVIALQITGILPDFKKDKKTERDRDFDQAIAPHYTDCLDNYITQSHSSLFGDVDLAWLPNSAG